MLNDSGMGITQKVLIRSISLYFTIRPTVKETGLGLALSSDIGNKGQGRVLYLNARKGAYAEFIVQLPTYLYNNLESRRVGNKFPIRKLF